MNPVQRVVTDYVFLLGLDELYREAIKRHEVGELLDCARQVTGALQISPADDPVEGYYTESEPLTEYFLTMRALQQANIEGAGEVERSQQFQRLFEVASSPLYGEVRRDERLLPVGRDAMSAALIRTQQDWSIESLTEAASYIAREKDDFSLVVSSTHSVRFSTRSCLRLRPVRLKGTGLPGRTPTFWGAAFGSALTRVCKYSGSPN